VLTYEGNIPVELFEAGQRAADILNETITHHGFWDIRNSWMAFKLSDGSSDKQLYDTKQDAVRHQGNEFLCCYVCFRNLAQGARWKDMAIYIKFNRDLYGKGYRMPDPDSVTGGPQPVVTTRWNDFYRNKLFMPKLTPIDLQRMASEQSR
jgi:hypothetical protein